MFNSAQDYIEIFRRGEKCHDNALSGLVFDKQPDPEGLKVLGKELANGTEDVREKIVNLLVDIGRINYPCNELRSPKIIGLLIGPGFARVDAARSNAMAALSMYASPGALTEYGDIITEALKENPEPNALLLVAKAKPWQAWEEVDRLSWLPEWNKHGSSNRTAVRIARAALGDTTIEDEYIDWAEREEAAGNAEGLADILFLLARIGTLRSLQAICERMRTPLIIGHMNAYRKSVRLEAMDALRYAFPGYPELYSFRVREESDYTLVERFCTRSLGVEYNGTPRPEFFTYSSFSMA